ncbi:hypothetical protein [Paenibacillus sedimenti]|uniref:Uncharacterized protein n=1 Tax=Paenibacillus sedimenti TaxID=2770274 RepID=A0A926KVT1_9BACL|nr:hypothetical protein [Paenibacillus sedimenti]MBD0384228.1 hypothetical protein [Paenibacillus sedimenti]
MANIDKFLGIDIVTKQYPLFRDFLFSYATYNELKPIQTELLGSKDFWINTLSLHLSQAIIKWCGALEVIEAQHKQAWDSYRAGLVQSLGISEDEWTDYWNQMIDFRNKYSLFIGLIVVRRFIPDLELAYKSALFYDNWMREFISPDIFEGPYLKDEINDYYLKIKSTIPLLSKI